MVSTRTKFSAALLLAVLCVFFSPSAFAGDLALNPRNFAHEIGNQPLTLADQVYTMGITRAAGQQFVIRYQLSGNATFFTTPAVPTTTASATVSSPGVGGAGNSFVDYEVNPTGGGVLVGDTFTLGGTDDVIITGLAGLPIGTDVTLTVTLRDLFFAAIDASGTHTREVATILAASHLLAPTDTGTTIDATVDPSVTGFVVQNDDVFGRAEATVTIITQTAGVLNAAGTANYVASADVFKITVTGDFTGVSGTVNGVTPTSGFFWDLNDDNVSDPDERFVVNAGRTSATLVLNGAATGGLPHSIAFVPDGSQLAVRTFAISASIDAAAGATQDRASLQDPNSAWWQWGINGTFLRAVYATFAPGNDTKFRFVNNSAFPVIVQVDPTSGLVLDQALTGQTFTFNPALNVAGRPQFTIPANGSTHLELFDTPAPGTDAIGPLVSNLTGGAQPARARVNFLCLTNTANVSGQTLVASPLGIITIIPMVQNPGQPHVP